MKKRLLSVAIASIMLLALLPVSAFAHGTNGIAGNGTGGVYIDIYANEFKTLQQESSWGSMPMAPVGVHGLRQHASGR